jgi:hypothetical protein
MRIFSPLNPDAFPNDNGMVQRRASEKASGQNRTLTVVARDGTFLRPGLPTKFVAATRLKSSGWRCTIAGVSGVTANDHSYGVGTDGQPHLRHVSLPSHRDQATEDC